MQTTSRQYEQGGREWFAVEGDAGAVTFFVQSDFFFGPVRQYKGRRVSAGDLGYHKASSLTDDFRFSKDCEFNPTADGCEYSGYYAFEMLNVLVDNGPLAVLERLNAIYSQTFTAEEAA